MSGSSNKSVLVEALRFSLKGWRLLSIPLVAAAAALEALGLYPVLAFIVSALALVPLAGVLGHATEELSGHIGSAAGGLLNATIGNLAELIIGVLALSRGEVEVVKASITGSIIGNLLLVFGLAAFAGDRLVLAALRESVALYSRLVSFGLQKGARPIPVFVWRVNEELARRGARFVAAFNELFDDDLPEPVAENADLFFEAANEEKIVGRCICIARTEDPERFYHWAIRYGTDRRPTVEEFWDSEMWTTDRYHLRSRR